MKYTIGTAAKATGKAKSTISRDLKTGKLSAERLDDGSFSIDASDLIRVYQDVFRVDRSDNPLSNDTQPPETPIGTGGLQADVDRLREQLSQLNIERDRERNQLTDQIEDLRARLDKESEERSALSKRLLTDDRPRPVSEAIAAAPAVLPLTPAGPTKGVRGLLWRWLNAG